MFFIYNKATKRYLKQSYSTYDAARNAARKLIRKGKFGPWLAFLEPSRNPALCDYHLAIRVL